MKALVSATFFIISFFLSSPSLSAQCNFADDCLDVSMLFTPVTNEDFSFNFLCVNDCLEGALPENDLPLGVDCKFSENPSIWFKIELDALAEQIFISADATGWVPVWALFSGESCDDLVQMDQSNNMSPACSNMDNTPDLSQDTLYNGSKSYYLLLTSDRTLDELSSDFELCVATTTTPSICIGDLDDNCFVSDTTYQVVSREFPGALDGPFLPAERITVCVDYFYDGTSAGAEWMNSLIPSFGENWDRSFFDPSSLIIGQSQWLETDGDCGPILQEEIRNICTYTNSEGELTLCNTLCQSCPCEIGMQEGDPLPSGWFWITNGGNAGCENDCSPGEGWGSGTTTFQFNFCMDLKIKDQPDYNNTNGLQISMNAISDGVAGCWEDPTGECTIFKPFLSPIWKLITCEETALNDFRISEFNDCDSNGIICNGELVTVFTENFPAQTEFTWTLTNQEGELITSQDEATFSANIYEEGQLDLTVIARVNCQSVIIDTSLMVFPATELDSIFINECSGFIIDINPEDYIGFEGDIDPFSVIESDVDTLYEVIFFTEDSCGCRSNQYHHIEVYVEEEIYDTVFVDSDVFDLIYQDSLITSLGDHIIGVAGGGINGCGAIYYLTVELLSSTSSVEQSSLRVFPNPTKDILNIESIDLWDIEEMIIIDLQGRQVEHNLFTNVIDVSGLVNGVYLIKFKIEDGSIEYHRFIKL